MLTRAPTGGIIRFRLAAGQSDSRVTQEAATFREQRKMARAAILTALILAFIPTATLAKDTRFWNLTAHTITSLQLSSPGKNAWGPNQTDNDRDRTVDHDERLKITDTAAGIYDVRFVDRSGRTCIVPSLEIKTGGVFTIEEKDLKGCTK